MRTKPSVGPLVSLALTLPLAFSCAAVKKVYEKPKQSKTPSCIELSRELNNPRVLNNGTVVQFRPTSIKLSQFFKDGSTNSYFVYPKNEKVCKSTKSGDRVSAIDCRTWEYAEQGGGDLASVVKFGRAFAGNDGAICSKP